MIALLIACSVGACSRFFPKLDEVVSDKRTEYRKATTLPDLEVPPDLTTDSIEDRMAIPQGGGATYSTYQQRRAERLQRQGVGVAGDVARQKLADESLLVVPAAAAQVWPRLREFWGTRGVALSLDDAELGVMETVWRENREELSRDKFKIFAEQGDDGATTVLYISHVGEEQIPQGEELVWRSRPRDPAIEAGVVEALKDYLGGRGGAPAVEVATAGDVAASGAGSAPGRSDRVELVNAGNGKMYLTLKQDFAHAWTSTGEALEHAGVDVEQADKDRGVYRIRVENGEPEEKRGVWSRLAFWKKDGNGGSYRLSLTGVGDKTEVVLLDDEGRWDTSESAGRLMVRLHEELSKIL
jgi:outer membrane protein assembly factor BamC